jgi:hypothetical protein
MLGQLDVQLHGVMHGQVSYASLHCVDSSHGSVVQQLSCMQWRLQHNSSCPTRCSCC